MRRGHISFRSGNPALSSKTFENVSSNSTTDVMTLDGTVNKIFISLLILLACSYYTFSTQNISFIMLGMIPPNIYRLFVFPKNKSNTNSISIPNGFNPQISCYILCKFNHFGLCFSIFFFSTFVCI